LGVPESRVIAGLLLRGRSVLVRGRPSQVEAPLWKLIQDGSVEEATPACLASALNKLGDFLGLVVRDQYRTFAGTLADSLDRLPRGVPRS